MFLFFALKELLSNARDVEKTTAAMSALAAQMVDEYGAGKQGNLFIGAGSPRRGMTGEAFLLSARGGGGAGHSPPRRQRPVLVQTGGRGR
jgi:hypothetical protein